MGGFYFSIEIVAGENLKAISYVLILWSQFASNFLVYCSLSEEPHEPESQFISLRRHLVWKTLFWQRKLHWHKPNSFLMHEGFPHMLCVKLWSRLRTSGDWRDLCVPLHNTARCINNGTLGFWHLDDVHVEFKWDPLSGGSKVMGQMAYKQ